LLLEALANAPTTTSATYAEISTALECLTDQGGALHPNTLAVVRRCFEGPAAAASSVFGPGGQLHKCGARWACQWVEPDQEGLLPGIGELRGRYWLKALLSSNSQQFCACSTIVLPPDTRYVP
jgi:hypothetical protein